jgi:pyruvate/2-oxoacid:ferredoxin oxidoreductase beta subunit
MYITAIWLTPGGSSTVHIHTQTVHRNKNGTYITIKRKKKKRKCGPCSVFASYNLAFALRLRKTRGKSSIRVVKKCPDIPVAVVDVD